MKRLMEYTVFVGLVTACRRATSPTRRSPFLANATTDGVVRNPSSFAITLGSPPSMTATHEFVVPRSMPITLPIRNRLPSNMLARHARRESRGRDVGSHDLRLDLDFDLARASFLGLGH